MDSASLPVTLDTSTEYDLSGLLPAGSRILLGHSGAEPTGLVKLLDRQASRLALDSTFVGLSFTQTLSGPSAAHLHLRALGGAGTNRRFARMGMLDIVPCQYSLVPEMITSGRIGFDAALLQVSPAAAGAFNLGIVTDYLATAASVAPRILVEVNDQMPRTFGDTEITADRVHTVLHTSRPLIEQPPSLPSDIDRAIGAHVARLVPDGATLQIGLGSIPEAVLASLAGKRDLGIHSGVIGDGVVSLIEAGAVTGRRKERDQGVVVTGSLLGTRRLYSWADMNAAVRLRSSTYTHSAAILAGFETLVTINSAIEVDLTGQINAEVAAGEHIGVLGGHTDFVRAGARSLKGRSIVALPSAARAGKTTRIVAQLSRGVVSTSRGDADTIVTEYGIAELKGLSLRERARALIAIAHPDFRSDLEKAAESLV